MFNYLCTFGSAGLLLVMECSYHCFFVLFFFSVTSVNDFNASSDTDEVFYTKDGGFITVGERMTGSVDSFHVMRRSG